VSQVFTADLNSAFGSGTFASSLYQTSGFRRAVTVNPSPLLDLVHLEKEDSSGASRGDDACCRELKGEQRTRQV
jgi:hypothetical protein